MSYFEELKKLKRDDPDAAISVIKKFAKSGELNFRNSEPLILLQTADKDREKVQDALNELVASPEKKK